MYKYFKYISGSTKFYYGSKIRNEKILSLQTQKKRGKSTKKEI